MPEFIVIVIAAVAFVAIGARFLPRNEAGQVQLPAIVDQSVGMWMLRQMLGRDPGAALGGDAASVRDPAEDNVAQIAHRIGVPGAPAPTLPTRFVVSGAPPQAHPLPRPAPVTPVTAFDPVRWRAQARPRAALAVQRRIAGVLAIGAVAVTMLAVTMLPRGAAGQVLSATGTPGSTSDAAIGATPRSEPPVSSGSFVPSDPPGASLPPDASAPPLAPVQTPPGATPAPTARPTPTRTPTPTPRSSTSVTPSPTASASPSAAPTPTDTPAPTPSDLPSPTPSEPSEPPP